MKFWSLVLIIISQATFAEVKECSNVVIEEVLAGPQYDSLFKIDGKDCIGNYYVCMHPKEGYLDSETANAVKSTVLTAFASGKTVQVRVDDSKTGCNGFPMVYLVRAIQ